MSRFSLLIMAMYNRVVMKNNIESERIEIAHRYLLRVNVNLRHGLRLQATYRDLMASWGPRRGTSTFHHDISSCSRLKFKLGGSRVNVKDLDPRRRNVTVLQRIWQAGRVPNISFSRPQGALLIMTSIPQDLARSRGSFRGFKVSALCVKELWHWGASHGPRWLGLFHNPSSFKVKCWSFQVFACWISAFLLLL